ncbi:SagB family peptide dehydrogenase [Kitasatospora sp. NPDC001539]|uniref:SagB family peptide dehydrogenase n=1 Tax=Kitasatospora sp. NPDC001539 TaxID=3154384 RepID=UPI0033227585
MPTSDGILAAARAAGGARPRALWSLREDVLVEPVEPDGSLLLRAGWGDFRLDRPHPLVAETLRRMGLGPIMLENVFAGALPAGGGGDPVPDRAGQTEVLRVLHRLQHLVVRSLGLEDAAQPLLSVVPLAKEARFHPGPVEPGRPVRLSRFAFLRTEGAGFVLEAPTALHRVELHRPESARVVGMLGRPVRPAEIVPESGLSEPAVLAVLAHLAGAGLLSVAEDGGPAPRPSVELIRLSAPTFGEDADPVLAAWSGVDLFFHTRSTTGRHDGPFGATYPLRGHTDPEPALRPLPAGRRHPLARPDLKQVLAGDPVLTTVIEGRRSIREFGAAPFTAEQLGEFLHRTVRVRGLRPAAADDPSGEPVSDRPYPSGDGAYELEFYPAVRDCEGLPDGIYYYAPGEHCLIAVNESREELDELFAEAAVGARLATPPGVVVAITSRHRRLSWRFSGLAYALTLKHVGVVTQSMYLVGTAMGLATCALRSGDIELADRALRVDWRAESRVGGFVLGTLPEGSRPVGEQPVDPADFTGWDECANEVSSRR